MNIVAFIILILLSQLGYSIGAVAMASKKELKPQIMDLLLLLAIWAGGIYLGLSLNLNRWIMIFIWLAASIIIGMLAVMPRKLNTKVVPNKAIGTGENKDNKSMNLFRRLWNKYKEFFARVGSFQTGIDLALFFFTVIVPAALILKMSADPLGLKYRDNKTQWLDRIETKVDLDQSKRQF
ncbi:MAG: hypothetical protein ABSA18_17470 [Dehalococcoidia bacterium]|jgi:hypothetical protein